MLKKLMKCFLAALLIGLTVVGSGGITAQASETPNELVVKAKQVIDFPINTLSKEVQQQYIENGWKITDDGAVREVVLTDGEVFVDGTKYDLQDSGIISVNSILNKGKTVSTDEHFMRTATVDIIDGKPTVVFLVDMGELFDHMDSEQFKISPLKDYGSKYYPGDWVHCNRFNGPASDDVHYKKTNPKAWVNFAGSDCDLALVRSTVCWGHSYCNQSGPAGGCSIVIGHSAKYHRH